MDQIQLLRAIESRNNEDRLQLINELVLKEWSEKDRESFNELYLNPNSLNKKLPKLLAIFLELRMNDMAINLLVSYGKDYSNSIFPLINKFLVGRAMYFLDKLVLLKTKKHTRDGGIYQSIIEKDYQFFICLIDGYSPMKRDLRELTSACCITKDMRFSPHVITHLYFWAIESSSNPLEYIIKKFVPNTIDTKVFIIESMKKMNLYTYKQMLFLTLDSKNIGLNPDTYQALYLTGMKLKHIISYGDLSDNPGYREWRANFREVEIQEEECCGDCDDRSRVMSEKREEWNDSSKKREEWNEWNEWNDKTEER